MIVAMPNGHTQNAAAPGESSRNYVPPMGGGPRKAEASMEDSFGDIKKFVESNYPNSVNAVVEFVKKLQVQQKNGFKLYWIACGDTDFLYQSVKDGMKKMDEIGFNYSYRESSEGHIWKNWRIYLSEFAPMLFK
ncbi:MAG: hypothetical protein LLF80_01715 [Porphyromonadaceae bacterium]|nr:hypothetical protein [Porphyromonadaceae bacterium]